MSEVRIYAEYPLPGSLALIRDVVPEDIDHYVNYWLHQGDAHIRMMGVRKEMIGDEAKVRWRFESSVFTGDPDQEHIAFTIEHEGSPIGYINLNRYAPDLNFSHVHIVEPGMRSSAVVTLGFAYYVEATFDLLPKVERLVFQTRCRLRGINRMLDRFIDVAETEHLDKPDGTLAKPGRFHTRYATRQDIPRLHSVSAQLLHAIESGSVFIGVEDK